MFYPSRVTQFVINGSRGDGKDSYSLRVSFRPQPEPTPTSLQPLAKPAFLCGCLTRSLLMKAATSPLRAVLPGPWAWRS